VAAGFLLAIGDIENTSPISFTITQGMSPTVQSVYIHIDSLNPTIGTIPILIELVSFQPPTLLATDFDRSLQPPLASVVVSMEIDDTTGASRSRFAPLLTVTYF